LGERGKRSIRRRADVGFVQGLGLRHKQ
jgi:hypothetical protein